VSQVVFEACSQAGWIHNLGESLALPALVASTSGAAWQWKRVKLKTDRDDTLKMARLAAKVNRRVPGSAGERPESHSWISVFPQVGWR
jgi:hypothetical protein